MTGPADRVGRFRELHGSGCFVMPNPWDPGSARLLERLGFPALATTSAGNEWSQGRRDRQVALDDALRHFEVMSASVAVPVSGDFEGGFAADPEGVRRNVARAAPISADCQKLQLSFGSTHPGGMNMVRCDGSVDYLNEDIDAVAWSAMGTRDSQITVKERTRRRVCIKSDARLA